MLLFKKVSTDLKNIEILEVWILEFEDEGIPRLWTHSHIDNRNKK